MDGDNNATYPSPTELTTNATYNMEAEQEYEMDKTGKKTSRLLTELWLTFQVLGRPDPRTRWRSILCH